MFSLMQNKGKTDIGKPRLHFCLMTLPLQARVEYANSDCEINQLKHSLSLTAVLILV